ncbi:MAG: hypothetical protein IIC62_01925, partial [Proteobacteria bacterium]|nr:hypothetical protein [Pseudomonadota bacterium]
MRGLSRIVCPTPTAGDSEPDGDVDTLAPGAFATFTATYTVTQDDIDETDGDIDNTATATGSPDNGDPDVTDDDSEEVPVDQNPAIEVVKSFVDDNGGTVLVGDQITYTFVVENTG